MSVSSEGHVVSLQLNVSRRQPARAVESANFVAGVGIDGDRHATADIDRQGYQVLVIDKETLDSLGLGPGVVKENVTTAGIDVASLGPGRRLALGPDVLLEISKACHPCSRLDEVRSGLRKEMEGRRGMLASVVRGGAVSVGDPIRSSAPLDAAAK